MPYRHLQGEDAAAIRRAAGLEDDAALPATVFPDGTVLSRPSLQDVAQKCGLATTAGSPFYDVVVVGAGPAGLGAAVYAASEGLRVTTQARRNHVTQIDARTDPRGSAYYWIDEALDEYHPDGGRSDYEAVIAGYTSVTPLQPDMTDYQLLKQLDGQIE